MKITCKKAGTRKQPHGCSREAALFCLPSLPGKVSFDILGVVTGTIANIGSARNKRKGMAITGIFKIETDPFIHSPLMVSGAFPSIGVKIVLSSE